PLLCADLSRQFVVDACLSFGIERLGCLRNPSHSFAAKRSVDEGLLAVVRAFQYVVSHSAEGQSQIQPRFGDIFYQRARKWAVLPIAITRYCTGLRSECN